MAIRMTYLINGVEVHRWQERLLKAADDLHSSANGSSERLPPERAFMLWSWMKCRLEDWEPSLTPQCKPYDDAVRRVVELALSPWVP